MANMLESLIHHVALPPQLPGKRESSIDRIEQALTDRLLKATRTLCSVTEGVQHRQWDFTRRTLQTCKELCVGGKVSKTSVLYEFGRLEHNELLILHITQQNAGLLVRRQREANTDTVIFEAFEASPLSEKVLAAKGALIWDFPGYAVGLPYSEFSQASFQESLASFLEQASTESIKQFAARAYKAGSMVFESRDTADPSLITEMLMTLLEVNGHRIQPPIIRKRIRDEVYWTEGGGDYPWRRSPYWLIVRVALQRFLSVLYGGPIGRAHYKFLLCVLLRELIEEALDSVSPDLVALLQIKLARRLSKLEVEKGRAPLSIEPVYHANFLALQDLFLTTLKKAKNHLSLAWGKFKSGIQKEVSILPKRAFPIHTKLLLPNSEGYLRKVLSWQTQMDNETRSAESSGLSSSSDVVSATKGPFKNFADLYFSLSRFEHDMAIKHQLKVGEPTKLCVKIADTIHDYLSKVGEAYQSNPEEKSMMILSTMELWMTMDSLACELFPLLRDYNPGFPSEVLDVLQLLFYEDMLRLETIQAYLKNRHARCNLPHKTIFDDPGRACFAERYFDESSESPKLQQLLQEIELKSRTKRIEKEQQWRSLSSQFDQLQRTILQSRCTFTVEDNYRSQHDEHCEKCYLENKRDRMRIRVHEHPLPTDPIQAKTVVFELDCPKAFNAYRNATWAILGILARPRQGQRFEPRLVLPEYSELREWTEPTAQGICLASSTKSFLRTHYHGMSLPIPLDEVCLPNALKLGYFDAVTGVWPGRDTYKPSFAQHCPVQIPVESPLSYLQSLPEFSSDADGPSSYEVLASQSRCPSELNEHEFTAFQNLFSGKSKRWIYLLLELGSSNLNFGTEAVSLVVSQLTVQAGPASQDDALRSIHGCFRDRQLCERLIEQIELRLDGIASNWREIVCMEMLLTLILRLCSIATELVVITSRKLLEKARATTLHWTRQLRADVQSSTSVETSRRCSQYAFRSALLCRRSFAMHAASAADYSPVDLRLLDKAALECFIECSITYQDNMPEEPATLPLFFKNMLIRDLKMVHRLRYVLRQSIKADPSSFYNAINNVWPQADGSASRHFSNLVFVQPASEFWVMSSICSTAYTKQQIVHFHLLEGHLLIDGLPLGKMPAHHRKSLVLKQLFGDQSLLTYPSSLYGMTYTLAHVVNGHQIHIGFRGGTLIVRACVKGTVLELIPESVFGGARSFDLPAPLVEHCVHWCDLNNHTLEIRQQPDIWVSKPSNWTLNFKSRLAYRRNSLLVCPHSLPFRRIAQIFDRFEYRGRLTIFQPQSERATLSVELRRLELSFFVNGKGLLECRQLGSEIDPNQDAGVWYGLNSKIILRETINPRQRSIIVPMGQVKYNRNNFHVSVDIDNNGAYGIYFINEILGRLDCPPEPRLLYLKAHLHACTSFTIPDPLTSRTGVEEALHCLQAGYCQPWSPLNLRPLQTLLAIAKISPIRQYYPKEGGKMQQVFWDPQLTPTIQHDEFRTIAETIYEKSKLLESFSPNLSSQSTIEFERQSVHLSDRSARRRCLYQRLSSQVVENQVDQDLHYITRGCSKGDQKRRNVRESVSLLRAWSTNIRTTSDLAGLLQSWPSIGGLDHDFSPSLLSGLLNIQPSEQWGSMINLCRHAGRNESYKLSFLFATICYGEKVDMDAIRVWIAFAIMDSLKSLSPPLWSTYTDFRYNEVPSAYHFVQLIDECRLPYPGDERDFLGVAIGHKMLKKLQNDQSKHEQLTLRLCNALISSILNQWPCSEPRDSAEVEPFLLDVPRAMSIIRPEWLRLFQNLELSYFVGKVQCILDANRTNQDLDVSTSCTLSQEILPVSFSDAGNVPALYELMGKPGPTSPPMKPPIDHTKSLFAPAIPQHCVNAGASAKKENVPFKPANTTKSEAAKVFPEVNELEEILDQTVKSKSIVKQRYGSDLRISLNALKHVREVAKEDSYMVAPFDTDAEIDMAREAINVMFNDLCVAAEEGDARVRWLHTGWLWPCITPVTLLEQLRTKSKRTFGNTMKASLVKYAISITQLQRLLRIGDAKRKGQTQRLNDELKNSGHENWNPRDYLDWLLLEIDANILIRKGQVEVALATISPTSTMNSVLQMNMGQGKTSCIMPMAAAILANTENLLRVVVPQSLLAQTSQLLQARIGGLLGREVRHVPFSRRTKTDETTISQYFGLHESIRASSGVIVALPEHILSFKLSGLQRLSDSQIKEATKMIHMEALIRGRSRDILDESDFTLAVRTQLVYPSGSQATVNGHPHRWETAEILLRMLEGHLWNLQQQFPQSIEVVRRPQGGFPIIYFLRRDVEVALIERLVRDIVRGQTAILPNNSYTPSDRMAIKHFISSDSVPKTLLDRIDRTFADKPVIKQKLCLIRGLLVHRILLLTLKKRWNVQYGLHPSRYPIAVPFHAKGVPSEQAEWGHPDVAILFTCLSFYYGGLNLVQLRQSLEHLVKSDDPSSEYDRWIHTSETLPSSLWDWNAINVGDEVQLLEIWQHIRYKVVVVDYFLNHFVFPRHAKQFRLKIQASGWDIPLLSSDQQSTNTNFGVKQLTKPLTTGFSGTNDNKTMLPLNIKQADLPSLLQTSAEVLTYLLKPANRRYLLASDMRGRRLTEVDLLRMLYSNDIRMLIDSGAQILEMDNLSLAKTWLRIDPQAQAALYFNEENKPYICYRHGSRVPLAASPFVDDLSGCLVYLDDAHTRGTDLKMPAMARGALTLGLGQTKDHTVQAAMRLRQLATTQSVVFVAPPEVHQSILDLRQKPPGPVDSSDVVSWLLEQTCNGIEQMQPLFYSQGVDYCNRTQAALENTKFLEETDQREAYLGVLRQKELQTLDQLYKPAKKIKALTSKVEYSPSIGAFVKELNTRRKAFQDNGVAVRGSALQEVEQEREVAIEVETIQERQKPVHYSPLHFPGLHRDITRFVETGRLAAGSAGYEHVLIALRRTTIGQKYGINPDSSDSRLYVSTEFARTVNLPSGRPSHSLLRPVNWILWSTVSESALIIIPEEAELLLPRLKQANNSITHLLTYAAPVTRKMLRFNDLTYYTLPTLPKSWKPPTWLTVELGIFAGRLYFEYEEYEDLRKYLGLQAEDQDLETDETLSPTEAHAIDAITVNAPSLDQQKPRTFTSRPLQFLQDWLAARRRGQDFTHTPMGYVCQDKPLNASHAFFAKVDKAGAPVPTATTVGNGYTTHAKGENDAEDGGDEGWADDGMGGHGIVDEGVEGELANWGDEEDALDQEVNKSSEEDEEETSEEDESEDGDDESSEEDGYESSEDGDGEDY